MYPPISLPLRRPWLARLALASAALAGCAAAPSNAPPLSAPPSLSTSARPTEAANSQVALQQDFARWVAKFLTTARAAGIGEATLHAAFDGVHYLPRVVELDRAQPEFTRTVWDYLDNTVSAQRV
ncbi:MAG: lytic murein transglycosylase, partial [Ferruginibacter sp.]|nr:lytic murein transglycosylase [Rhodoferax sp.]